MTMEIQVRSSRMSDGSVVWAVDVDVEHATLLSVDCIDKKHAMKFARELRASIAAHTCERAQVRVGEWLMPA